MNRKYIPMSETAYYVLLSLLDERHGYGIMQYISQITSDRIHIGAGTLYGTLAKMEADKLIHLTKEIDNRKVYKISEIGVEVLKCEFKRIQELYLNGGEALNNV